MIHEFVLRIALSLIWVVTIATTTNAIDLKSRIDPLAEPLVKDGVVVGLIIGIVKDGETQILAFGETAKDSGKAPDGKSVYEIGSATKAFTGVLLADAVETGRVKLNEPVQKYLPERVKMLSFNDKPIALEHLATHTSGLPRLPDNMKPRDAGNPYAGYTVKRLYESLGKIKLERGPGQYEYSNLGMGLLGHVLARQAGKSYEKLIVERIAKPIGMTDTSIRLNKGQRERLALPYDAALKPQKNWDLPTLAGAGAIRSTVDDMLKFLQANLVEDDKSLSKALSAARVKHHTTPDGMAIGLGWHQAKDGLTWWHNGMTGGYTSWMSVVPNMKVGVVVLSNTATMKISELGEQVTRVACGVPVRPSAERTVVDVEPAVIESSVGVYPIAPTFALTVTLEDGKLMVQATGQDKFQVFPESKTKFFYKVVDAQITFEPGDDGKAKRLTLHQNGQNMPAARQE